MTKKDYKGAVLIVGSLCWDKNAVRERWRRERLKFDKKVYVYAPIRYGKRSLTRGDTYTMIISQLCYRKDYGLGTALLVPCKREVQSYSDLRIEAAELWHAERSNSNIGSFEISQRWGALGILLNPQFNIPEDIRQGWQELYRGQEVKVELVQTKTERPIIDDNGFLNIRWPKFVSNDLPDDVDFILATATQPTLKNERYPTIYTIAQAWLDDNQGFVEYFEQNLKNGITTFQDKRLQAILDANK